MHFPTICLVFSLLVHLGTSGEIPSKVAEEWNNLISPFKDECLPKSKNDQEEVDDIIKQAHVKDNINICKYLKCLYEKLNLFGPDGEIMESAIVETFSYMTPTITRKCVEETASVFPPEVVKEWVNAISPFESECMPTEFQAKEEVDAMIKKGHVKDCLNICQYLLPTTNIEEWVNKTSSFQSKCLPNDNKGMEELEVLYENGLVGNSASMCEYLKCMFEMLMFFGPNGEIMENVIMETLSYMTANITKKCANEAALIADKCQKAYTFGNCAAIELSN
ncbi:hypothetical protein FQR65_LT09859 [Abscondita terminalis]|nr:hypothetical protein FQR65_LT09859 [Abscondita terminalis]